MRTGEKKSFLKDCIADSMIELLKKKSIDDIQIEEISELSGVGRSTYYRHFNGKKDVLLYFYNSCYNQWKYDNKVHISDLTKKEDCKLFLDFFRQIKDINFLMYRRQLKTVIFKFIEERVYESFPSGKAEKTDDNKENTKSDKNNKYKAIFFTGIYTALIDQWIKDGYEGDICAFLFDNISL